ncbi:MAG: hypothetical protein JW882_00965 [Deltaproteobacteria bacterium]|nr:hypothetical protein [Deltaproteobacteria bacterium]
MRKKILIFSLLFVVVALISIGVTPLATGQADTAKSNERLVTVLNPAISSRMVERIPLAPRTDTLEGKTIYLVDLQWGGPKAAYSVFEEMQDWFSRNMPSVKVEIRRASSGWMGDDAGLRKEIISKKAGGVVIGIGG